MADITKADKNFIVETTIKKEDIEFFDVDEKPFKVYGVFREGEKYRRVPESVAKSVSDGFYIMHANTAGGRVRFITDSPYVAIHAEMDGLVKMSHFAPTGIMGFDMYADGRYTKTFVPPKNIETGYESVHDFDGAEEREILINFPLYADVKTLHIGLKKGSTIKEAPLYKNTKPIVCYGSSITQGGCASRPGMSYESILSRKYDLDYINLGFAGCARGEDEIVDYMKTLDMSVFVLDYDHNAPNAEHLEKTHEKVFKAIRETHPDIPVIMMSRPKFYLTEQEVQRRRIVETTYLNAAGAGDKNVYFIDGAALTKLCGSEGTVDNVHPTDYGFASMAAAMAEVIEKIDII